MVTETVKEKVNMKTNVNHEIVSSEVVILGKMDSTEPETGTPVHIQRWPDIAKLWEKVPGTAVDRLERRLDRCSDRKFTVISLRSDGISTFKEGHKSFRITSVRGFLQLPCMPSLDIKFVDFDVRFSGKGRYIFRILPPDGVASLYACRGYKNYNIGDEEFLPGSYRLSLFFTLEGGGAFFLLDATSAVPPFFSGSVSPTEDFTFFEQLKAMNDDIKDEV